MKGYVFYCAVIGLCLVSACVSQDQLLVLENRVAAVERENQQRAALQANEADTVDRLKADLNQDARTTRESYAELKYEVQQLKEQYFRVQGQLEELQHQFGTSDRTHRKDLEKRLDRLDNAISKNYEKVIALEKYMGFEPSAATDGNTAPLESGSTPAEQTEDGLYAFAKKLFDDGDQENARLQFENFINKFPESKKADNARFWIADSYYVEKWFEKAILEYQKVLETYPDSNKTKAARLKQGYAFAALGETANARLILKELIKRHPDSQEAKYAQEKLKNLK